MRTLEKNVINTWGQKGKEWLDELQTTIKKLSKYWSLTDIKPVNNMSYNFVAFALQKKSKSVVLKISCDETLINDEYKALKHFDGHGAIKVFDINTSFNALLLEQATPGYLLKDHHPKKIDDTIQIYANVVKAIASQSFPDNKYHHVSKWCDAIDRIQDERIEKKFIDKAKQLRSKLLNSTEKEYLCHGDLHLENIIQHGSSWVCIDPKGIIGEMAFEAAAFDLINKQEIKDTSTIADKIIARITLLSTDLALEITRLSSWIFLRLIISAQWFIEDNGDPKDSLLLLNYIYPFISK